MKKKESTKSKKVKKYVTPNYLHVTEPEKVTYNGKEIEHKPQVLEDSKKGNSPS